MARIQLQLPDNVFAKAKKLCEAREISLAELARRGIEYMLRVDAQESAQKDEWQPPKPRNLGWKGLSHTEVKKQAQLTTTKLR